MLACLANMTGLHKFVFTHKVMVMFSGKPDMHTPISRYTCTTFAASFPKSLDT